MFLYFVSPPPPPLATSLVQYTAEKLGIVYFLFEVSAKYQVFCFLRVGVDPSAALQVMIYILILAVSYIKIFLKRINNSRSKYKENQYGGEHLVIGGRNYYINWASLNSFLLNFLAKYWFV